jgi:heme exporter protein A
VTQLLLDNVTIERGNRTLFAPLSFTANAGTLVRIAGANGAGKTTLLRALAGLTAIASGKLSWLTPSSPSYIGRSSVFIGHSNSMNGSWKALEDTLFLVKRLK